MALLPITILICTRNRPEQLTRCLSSILKLDYPSYELVVVDNASNHVHIPKLNYLVPTKFFSCPKPGLSRARNSVLKEINTEFLALMDDDAVAEQRWLSAAVSHFDDPAIGCVTGRILPLETKTEWQERQLEKGLVSTSNSGRVFDKSNFNPLTSAPGSGSNIIIRTDIIRKIRFPETFGPGTPVYAGDEHMLFYRIIVENWKIHYEPQSIVYHDYVETEAEFRNRMFRMMVSRGALLTTFALFEKGQRLHTINHLLRKIFAQRSEHGMAIPPTTKLQGLLWGPLALFASTFTNKPGQTELVQQFPDDTKFNQNGISFRT